MTDPTRCLTHRSPTHPPLGDRGPLRSSRLAGRPCCGQHQAVHAAHFPGLRLSGGQDFPAPARTFVEDRWGHDFSHVRIHTASPAAMAATRIGSEATATIRRFPGPGPGEAGGGLRLLDTEIPSPLVVQRPGAIAATLYFGQDRFLLDSANLAAVERVANQLRMMYQPTITVEGHGDADYNLRLSALRRRGVIALLNAAIPTSLSIAGQAHGETLPAAAETATDGATLAQQRARNRRVEILVISSRSAPAAAPAAPPARQPLDLTLPPLRPETLEERLNRILRTPPPTLERRTFSIRGVLEERFNTFMDRALRRIDVDPNSRLGGFIKNGARGLVERGLRAPLDEVLEQSGLSSEAQEAIRSAVQAGIRQEFEY